MIPRTLKSVPMSISSRTLLLLLTVVSLSAASASAAECPLNFTVLRQFSRGTTASRPDFSDDCQYIRLGLRLVLSQYLKLTGSFLPPVNSSDSCWNAYQSVVDETRPNFNVRTSCGFQTGWISQGCMNITTKSEFERVVSKSALTSVVASCNQSLENGSPCASCTTRLAIVQASFLTGPSIGNVTDCPAYPSIYAAAFANPFGPTDQGTAKCLFSLNPPSSGDSSGKKLNTVVLVVLICCSVAAATAAVVAGGWFFWRKQGKSKKNDRIRRVETGMGSGLESISASTTLVKFTFDEIKRATRNFSRDNIIGRGGYGNVYKGVLSDDSEVALKRFKNCSAAGDAIFAHEVEVISSVRHVNLVALRGYCIATTPLEGHQRIIVCDLMKNGSVYDHLFGYSDKRLSWPIRQKIALGTARGLAYLHYGAQPAIIHRDIKASNILLDENFEPKVADFGLAKFTPEGMTHLSTRVAGTMGYVAPEYALYGQLTERSDVYSFGVVLLELLSGRKALGVRSAESQPFLVTDWAWSLVREQKAMDVVEEGMPELGSPEVVEKYVLIAVLCSHPQLYARPSMDQIVKMLETDLSVPSIPERPISLVAEIDEIERSMSSSGSVQHSGSIGFHSYT
ncbi:probable LRR receptor-like serine/threonine-protein kinase RKF3 [Cucurbita moschata]|uniref:non-specific serine/threonine protein kinase n=1 Tax=Cucurbita moschata TaxID=3662 RepID=A0A6J1H7P1_CUCMO|nr:probable LRR receptor-like serine/threonine-protein kinase RKF3 [Cucurbita moschata]